MAPKRGLPRVKVTDEMKAEIVRRMNEADRPQIARELGISYSTLLSYMRQLNGGTLPPPEIDLRYAPDREERDLLVRLVYPHLSGHELDRALQWPVGTSSNVAKRLGVEHTPETLARVQRAKNEKSRARMYNISPEKRAEMNHSWKVRRRLDELRVMSGDHPRSRHKFGGIGYRATQKKSDLVRCYGYYYTDEPLTLAYDADTCRRVNKPGSRRIKQTEAYITAEIGIKFTPLK